jgi:outer membrane protein OmpA-like peptidoglycan-associated protein
MKAFFCAALVCSAVCAGAQTAAELDILLETPAVSFAQASRFVLAVSGAADYNPVDEGPTGHKSAAAAWALAREKGWLPARAAPDKTIRLGELCFLAMKAFNMKGSFLYALFPGPRYAFRELDFLALIPGRRDPAVRVSGEELLRLLEMLAVLREPEPPASWQGPKKIPADEIRREQEQVAEEIRVELELHEVEDTSVRVADEGVVISLNNIHFTPDSVELVEAEKAKLREIAVILARYSERKILVGGHTALAGSSGGRLQISTERAQAVANFLIVLEARRKEDVIVRGYGASQPLGDNATEAGQAVNRRVEIILLDREGR